MIPPAIVLRNKLFDFLPKAPELKAFGWAGQ
jgi:hypothetical protein